MSETPFKMKGFGGFGNSPAKSTSPLLGCAEDPTVKGCADFRRKKKKKIRVRKERTTSMERKRKRERKQEVKDRIKEEKDIIKQRKKEEKHKTSYKSPRYL